jgi:hypothetical protein
MASRFEQKLTKGTKISRFGSPFSPLPSVQSPSLVFRGVPRRGSSSSVPSVASVVVDPVLQAGRLFSLFSLAFMRVHSVASGFCFLLSALRSEVRSFNH